MAETMFETFGFEALQVQIQAMLSLCARGLLTGMVVDSGEGVTHCIPVTDGKVLEHSIFRINVAGRRITDYLQKLLSIRGHNFYTSWDYETIREIKEDVCYVSASIRDDRKLCRETTALDLDYQLPDGRWIRIGRERFEAPEALFNPGLMGREEDGIAEIIVKSARSTPLDNRGELLKHILLSGGNTMFPGIVTRLEREVKKIYSTYLNREENPQKKFEITVEDPPYRKYLVYNGGSALSYIMRDQPAFWVYKEEWQEEGPRIMHKPATGII
jgi:actin-related protein 2